MQSRYCEQEDQANVTSILLTLRFHTVCGIGDRGVMGGREGEGVIRERREKEIEKEMMFFFLYRFLPILVSTVLLME